MNTYKRVDPDLIPALEAYPPAELNAETLDTIRNERTKQHLEMNKILPKIDNVSQEDRPIPGPDGESNVHIRVYRPQKQSERLPGFLWIHGGGYVLGGIDGDDYPSKLRVKNIGCVVVSVNYRLAPENPYPAALEDCYAALKWMTDNANELGIDKTRISIGGASAGGGLAAALALLIRDRAEMNIIHQMLIYPMIDDCNIIQTGDSFPDTLIWTRAKNLFGWTSYLGKLPGGADVTPYEAVIRAKDLSGLPPAFIAVGDLDLFVDENMVYAGRLIGAGVPTEFHIYPGAYHGFNSFAPGARISRQCNAACDAALKKAFYG